MTPLSDNQIIAELTQLKGWLLNKNRLEKVFTFADFTRAMIFANKIINPIEENQHYPLITIAYNRVTISLFSNEVGTLSNLDFLLAREIETLV